MKSIQILLFGYLILFGAGILAQSKTGFEGKLLYHISYPDTSDASTMSGYAFPEELTVFTKGPLLKVMIGSLYVHSTDFTNFNLRKTLSYLELPAKKVSIESNLDSLIFQAYQRTPNQLEKTPITRVIQGHTCLKLIAHFDNKAIPDAVIYYTPDFTFLPTIYTLAFSNVQGLIMEISENYQGINMQIKIKDLDQSELQPSIFTQPSGFKLTPVSQLFNSLTKPY